MFPIPQSEIDRGLCRMESVVAQCIDGVQIRRFPGRQVAEHNADPRRNSEGHRHRSGHRLPQRPPPATAATASRHRTIHFLFLFPANSFFPFSAGF